MQNYTSSDYALNKYSKGIVYRFVGGVREITLTDYLADNPNKTKEDFLALKELSDAIYLEQVQDENAQTKKNTAYDELDETTLCVLSPEDLLIEKMNAQAEAKLRQKKLEMARNALESLTSVQRRRYLLYKIEGMATREIAALEGVAHQTVVECLSSADKKIKKYFSKILKNTLPKRG